MVLVVAPVAAATMPAPGEEEAKPGGPSAIEIFLNEVFAKINKVVVFALFFDVTWGAFESRALVNGDGA